MSDTAQDEHQVRGSILHEIRVAFREELTPAEKSGLWAWIAFTVTFGIVRGITYSIHAHDGPFRNISAGGTHLHHYVWGILILVVVGAIGLRGEEKARCHPMVGIFYGIGVALIVDEFALLLDLRDVYWAKQGRWSVDLAIGVIAVGGTVFAAIPIFKRLRGNGPH
ncbi:MAG: putative rane protein [Actinomycetia bacterium]|nr:putative rane protein [Actinomycetes bacterium]